MQKIEVIRLPVFALSLLLGVLSNNGCYAEKTVIVDADTDVQTAMKAIEAYQREDWDALVALFAEDAMLHSVMRDPFVGREVIKNRLLCFHETIDSVEINVNHIGKVDDVVVTERLDVW
jgi:ketosteroid isomerase-like protein